MGAFSQSLARVSTALECNKIEYMIVGSVASTIYGEPRLTRDIDIVISLKTHDLKALYTAFKPEEYYVPPKEILSQEIQRRGQFNLMDHATAFKIDIVLTKDSAHSRMEFSRRRMHQILPGLTAWVAAPEDIIIKKLQFFLEGNSEKHLLDIRGILANTEIDEVYLKDWIGSLRLESAWIRVQVGTHDYP